VNINYLTELILAVCFRKENSAGKKYASGLIVKKGLLYAAFIGFIKQVFI